MLLLFPCVLAAADDGRSVITIEDAQKTEYKKDPVNGGDAIILTGGVRISVARGSDKTTITADMVNYNRQTEMLYAEGNVSLMQTGANAGGEAVTAGSLLLNTSSLECIFDDGHIIQTQSDALNLPSGSKLSVVSTIFGRDSSNTIAFKNGELTFCDDDDPHWKIKASRIWLLPGGEFAFFNAFVFVGRVPLLYFPAFYYPKDELIFNPTFGYRQREGYFINTTTYLYGRKPQDAVSTADLHASSSDGSDDKLNFFSLVNTGMLKEQRREGLVLHNLDADFTGSTTNYFKIMGDYYSNLGAMVGFDGVYKPSSVLSNLEGKLMLGFSNTVFQSGAVYLPYDSTGERYQDSSNFIGMALPFRYMANFKATLSKPLSLSLTLPLYSDPYVNYDFNTRAETMDWIDFLMSGTESTDDDSVTEVSSFTWQLSGSYSPKSLPSFFGSYLNTFRVSSFSSSLLYSSLTNTSDDFRAGSSDYQSASPERKFYYPSQITPLKATLSIAGTVYEYPQPAKTTKKPSPSVKLIKPADFDTGEDDENASTEDADSADDEETEDEDAEDDDEADDEDADAESDEDGEDDDASDEDEDADTATEDAADASFGEGALPLIATTIPSVTTVAGLNYRLSYTISPTFTSQLTYSSTNLKSPDDFDWSDMQATYYQVQSPTVLTSTLGWRGSFVTLTDTFTFSPVYQEHPYLKELNDAKDNGGYTESSINSLKKTDYNARKLDLTDVNALSVRPFYYTEHFADTALTWNTTVKMIRTQYISEDVENPEWEYLTTELWNDECFTVHNLNLVLAAKEFDGKTSQQLSLTTSLPPQPDSYSGVLTLRFPYTSLSFGTGVHRKSSTDDTWVKDDFSQSLSVDLFGSKLRFTQSYVYDREVEEHESFRLSLSGYGAQLAYTMSYTTGYDFDGDSVDENGNTVWGKGWTVRSEQEFLPYSLSLSYASGTKTWTQWANRISVSPSVSTSLVYDCIRPTNSYFTFIPALTFKVNNFLDIKFSAESRNSVIFRYFQKYANEDISLPGETNLWQDLLDSFDFAHTEKRKASGFKMKSLNVTVTHDLHDWDLAASFSVKPRLTTDGGKSYYDFSPYFSISVAWRPMQGMKTEIVDEYGEWELNP